MTPASDTLDLLIAKAVFVAQSNLGFGEDSVNNEGRFIEAIGGRPGDEWCALFAGYPYRRAAQLLGHAPPMWCYAPGGRNPEKGAKALVRQMGEVGRFFTDPHEARPGDLVCWNSRVSLVSWKGHVEFVEVPDDGLLGTIAGNVGRVPAKTRRLIHDVTKEPHFYGIASLRR